MNKINVLFLLHDTRRSGGANASMFDVIENLEKSENINVIIAVPNKNGTLIEYLEETQREWYEIPYPNWIYRINDIWYKKSIKYIYQVARQRKIFSSIILLKKIISQKHIDIVYTNTFCIYLGCIARRYLNVKHIWHIREYGQEDHGFGVIFGNKLFHRCMNKNTDQIIFISKSLQNKYKMRLNSNSIVVYDDISRKYINKKNKNSDRIVVNILIAGLIQSGKGQLEVIQAFEVAYKRVKNIRLYIAGEIGSGYYYKLKKYIEQAGLSDVIQFTGFVQEMNKLRQEMDIGIVASRCEAFGRVTIEGMLSEMAMIGANSAGTSELIQDGITGILYNPGDINELATKILTLVEDTLLREQIAKNGFKYAKETFTEGIGAGKIEKIIMDCASK